MDERKTISPVLVIGLVMAPREERVCQLASPFPLTAVNTFPAPGIPCLIRTVPSTSSLAPGAVVPMPTLPELGANTILPLVPELVESRVRLPLD